MSYHPAQLVEKLLLTDTNPVVDYQQHSLPEMPAIYSAANLASLPENVVKPWVCDVIRRAGIDTLLDYESQKKLAPYQSGYALAKTTIDQMVKLGIMISGPPIKKQTLDDKHRIIKNFDELIKVYNCWIDKNPSIGEPFDDHTMQTQISSESNFWHSIMNSKDSVPALPPIQQ